MGPRIPCTPLRLSPPQYEDDDAWSSDDSTENENENILSNMLFTPTLEDLKNVLYVELNPYFEEFEIQVVSCPCLTRAPYKLAADGLSGKTGILQLGDIDNFYPRPRADITFDIQDILSTSSNDLFVIGSGFAAVPVMLRNGHLTMNAIVSANPANVINNSCIAYTNAFTGAPQFITIDDHNQIKCSLLGQFFFSEGKRGPVIKMRAKGRRSRSNIIALIQAALTNLCRYQPLMGLGIVLVLNGGKTDQRLLPHDFLNYDYNGVNDYHYRLTSYLSKCKNLIALGALISDRLKICHTIQKVFLRDDNSMFNVVCNSNTGGEFFNDITPKETEYILYINIAQERF